MAGLLLSCIQARGLLSSDTGNVVIFITSDARVISAMDKMATEVVTARCKEKLVLGDDGRKYDISEQLGRFLCSIKKLFS